MPLKTNGKLYEIDGQMIYLYPISKIAAELTENGITRSTQTIRKWEEKRIIPPTAFRDGDKRLYSEQYIETLVQVALECGIKQGKSVESTHFKERVWKALEGNGSMFSGDIDQADTEEDRHIRSLFEDEMEPVKINRGVPRDKGRILGKPNDRM